MNPISPLVSAAWVAGLVAAAAALYFIVDAIGDQREFKVRAEYAEAARKKNIDISAYNNATDALDALTDAAVAKALAKAVNVPSVVECKATPEQAEALTALRRTAK